MDRASIFPPWAFVGVEMVGSIRKNVEVVGSRTVGPLIEQMS